MPVHVLGRQLQVALQRAAPHRRPAARLRARPLGGGRLHNAGRVNASYVTASEKQRHDDMVWRLKVGPRWVWVYLLLEFQQEPEAHMALRMLGYVALLAQHLVQERQLNDDGTIPALLPVVLYTGDSAWHAPVQVADLFDASLPALQPYVPRLQHVLLQQHKLVKHEVPAVRNLAQAVFELEQGASRQQVLAVLQALQAWLADEASAPLRRHLTVWLKQWLRRSRRKGSIVQSLEQHADWLEPTMKLHEKLDMWYDQAVEEGAQKGQHEGLAKAVALQARLRFGELPAWAHERLQRASEDDLLGWLARMLTATSLEELLGRSH
ncbi:MAG: Rpn family recombination-promoting nuclease/putative transposase [Tepidimonas ignava]|nr:Rpn family recombination-promoting nuclease/putative transposase [Tepidimonas ignava]